VRFLRVNIIADIVIIVAIYHYSFCFAARYCRGTIYPRKIFCGTHNKILVLASEVKRLHAKISAENVKWVLKKRLSANHV
jgi:hypothetical protein